MTQWALLVLMILLLGRALAVPATPISALQLLPQNCSQTTSCPVASESPSATTTGSSADWSYNSHAPYLGSRITVSLDVPLGLLQILLEQARIRAAREWAAINARILANVGHR